MTALMDQPLEEQIAQWREYLRRRQAFHGSDIEELEGHLRDQLTALTESGLAGEEAFLVAVKRMGSLDVLSREFAREHSDRLWKQLVVPSAASGIATRDSDAVVAFAFAGPALPPCANVNIYIAGGPEYARKGAAGCRAGSAAR